MQEVIKDEKGHFLKNNDPRKNPKWIAAIAARIVRIRKECLNCKKEFFVIPAREKTAFYCSYSCHGTITGLRMAKKTSERMKLVRGEKHPRWKGHVLLNCIICGKEFWRYPSRKNRRHCSNKCANITRLSGTFGRAGELHYKYKKDRTKLVDKRRSSIMYNEFKKRVKIRDSNRCMDCGEIKEKMEVNHIYPWAQFPRLRFDVNNGEVLCKECHKVKSNAQMSKIKVLVYN